ncbi:MAG TPA: hypothetical protein VIM30_10725 [Candidatus Limnocylindrales bacterium]|jgi:hypothetical protein
MLLKIPMWACVKAVALALVKPTWLAVEVVAEVYLHHGFLMADRDIDVDRCPNEHWKLQTYPRSSA